MHSRRTRALFTSLCLLAACKEEPAAQPPPGPVPVTVVTLKAASVLLTRELPGRTSPFLVAEVRPQANGIILKRLFTEGGMVKAGEPLYQLDDAIYRADYGTAKAAVDRALTSQQSAQHEAKRAAELHRQAALSAAENEKAEAMLNFASADVKSAQAAMQRVGVMLNFARITAPISGRIGKSAVTQGSLVTANQPQALTTVQQLNPMYVDLTQSSGELLALRKEVAAGTLEKTDTTPVTLLLEDGSVYPHEGKLTFSDVTVDPSTGAYSLRVEVPNPESTLLPGMYLRARIGSGVRQEGLLVPQQGVTRDPKGNASAMVVTQDGKAESRMVKVSRTVGDKWLVDQGLADGDRVIIEGLQKVQPGAQVQATEAPSQIEAAR